MSSWGKDSLHPLADRGLKKPGPRKRLQGDEKENSIIAFDGWKNITATKEVWEVKTDLVSALR